MDHALTVTQQHKGISRQGRYPVDIFCSLAVKQDVAPDQAKDSILMRACCRQSVD